MTEAKRLMLAAIITTKIYLARAEADRRGVSVSAIFREWR